MKPLTWSLANVHDIETSIYRASYDTFKVAVAQISQLCCRLRASMHQFCWDQGHTNRRSGGASVGAGYTRDDGSLDQDLLKRRPTRDQSRLLHVARAEKKKATRYEANEVQIERGTPRDSRNPFGRTGTGCSWVNSSRREAQRDTPAANVEYSAVDSSSFSLEGPAPPEPDAPRFVVDLRWGNESKLAQPRNTPRKTQKNSPEISLLRWDLAQVKGIIFCFIIDGISIRRYRKFPVHLFLPQRWIYFNKSPYYYYYILLLVSWLLIFWLRRLICNERF